MDNFVFTSTPSHVIFGSGTIKSLPEKLRQLSLSRPLLVSTPAQVGQAKELNSVLKGHVEIAGIFPEATMHTPIHVTNKGLQFARDTQADSIVSIGGGSTIGLGKALSIRTGLYHIAIPTTYAGSEVTPILGETDGGRKTTRSDPKILPGTVIYDVDLTMTLPTSLTMTSGVNAIAHAVEALYARNSNPIIRLFAQEGIRALASSLHELVAAPQSPTARSLALYGAWMCGVCLGSVGMSLHHKLCHTLGGSFNLPHSETHAIVLPHAVAYNYSSVPGAMKMLADCLPGSDGDAIAGLNLLVGGLGVPTALQSVGMKEEDIATAAGIAMSNSYWNPRVIEEKPLREVIRRAWAGEKARADL